MTGRRTRAVLLVAWMLAACAPTAGGEVTSSSLQAPVAVTSIRPAPETTMPPTTVSTTIVRTVATSTTSTTVLKTVDCVGTTIVVFGNSIDAELDPDLPPWPIRMELLLSESEFLGVDVVDRAEPASMIVGPSPYDSGPMARLTTAIPEVMRDYTVADKARMIVLINPSFGEISNITAADNDDSVVQRAVTGIQQSVAIAQGEGIAAVIVMPMGPVAAAAEYLQGFPINRRISNVNMELERLDITPPSMRRSPLWDPRTDSGDPRYFDDFVSEGPIMAGSSDGVHPDADGQNAIATAMAHLVELRDVLALLCRP